MLSWALGGVTGGLIGAALCAATGHTPLPGMALAMIWAGVAAIMISKRDRGVCERCGKTIERSSNRVGG